AGAENAVVRPHRHAAPLPFLDDFGIGFFHESADAAQRFAPPIVQLFDSPVDEATGIGRSGSGRFCFLLRRAFCLHVRLSLFIPEASIGSAEAWPRRRTASRTRR